MQSLQHLGIATVAYADIFDYPLTHKEFRLWSIGRRVLPIAGKLEKKRQGRSWYLCLPHRDTCVTTRIARQHLALSKWEKARRAGERFRWIPTVMLAGVTGGLAMDNANESDDIDLFFIVSPGVLWITRLLVTLTAEVFHIRRKPGEASVRDQICLNMFMTEDSLGLPYGEQDLFAAHEVLQMKPLWQRNGVYRKFLSANRWVRRYLPNAWSGKVKTTQRSIGEENNGLLFTIPYVLFTIVEPLVRVVQLGYMKKHRTTEIITDGVLRFHPRDARLWVKKKFATRLAKFGIPLDSIFYSS